MRGHGLATLHDTVGAFDRLGRVERPDNLLQRCRFDGASFERICDGWSTHTRPSARSLADHIRRAISPGKRSTLITIPTTRVRCGPWLIVTEGSLRAIRQPNNVTSPTLSRRPTKLAMLLELALSSTASSAPRTASQGPARSWTHNVLVVGGEGKRRVWGNPWGLMGTPRIAGA